ncbi:MAG: YicC/YloC family endoribonuclease [Clostridia bacterium]
MAVSMTGYGMHILENDRIAVKVEMKSVNNRYLDINIRMPKNIFFMEEPIRKTIRKEMARGKVDVFINILRLENTEARVRLDKDLAGAYHRALLDLKQTFGLRGTVRPTHVAGLPGVVTVEEDANDPAYSEDVMEAVRRAAGKMKEMKRTEGQEMATDMLSKTDMMEKMVGEIKGFAEQVPAEYKERLSQRISELLQDGQVSEERIAQEVAFIADKACVDEEIIRLKSHILQFRNNMAKSDCGKKLDFIVQEMNREANTIGSKANSLEITDRVVELKYLIEKLREQAQNIE